MERWLNIPLLSNPANWLVVFFMLASGAIVVTVAVNAFAPASQQGGK